MPVRSSLARLQQVLTGFTVSLALAYLAATWSEAPVLALAGALAILFWTTWFLALEFVLLRLCTRGDPAPVPTVRQLLVAWLRESLESPTVFMWRQPFRWREVPDQLLASSDGKVGVVFIHGFVCNRGFWNPWMRRVRQAGYRFVGVNLEPVFGSIDDYVPTIEDAVQRVTAATGRPPVLVCHSMGGLAARAWLRQAGNETRVVHVFTIGSPHGGTWIARFSQLRNGRQMRLRSAWIQELEEAEAATRQVPFTCWYSNCDNIVFPPSTACRPGADNQLVEGAAHVDLAFRPEVIDQVLQKLSSL